MKKTEYYDVHVPAQEDRQLELDNVKKEEQGLPPFARDVPVSSRKKMSGDSVIVSYEWKDSKCESIRTKEITYRKGEQLSELYAIKARDGADTVSISRGGTVYILRKTTKEVARAVFNACSSLQSGLEKVAGWMASVLGSVYLISKVEHGAWSFDRRVAKHDNVHYVESDMLDDSQKSTLCGMIVRNIATLHARRLVLGNFTLNSLIFTKEGADFTDLRGLRATRKQSYCVEEFKSVMQYLFARGMMRHEDRYLAIATYHALNGPACAEWYQEKTGKKPAEEIHVTDRMEDEIFN